MAFKRWGDIGVDAKAYQDEASYTGAAGIFVDKDIGENPNMVCPGAAQSISAADTEADAHVRTILNPVPARVLPDGRLTMCDYLFF